jgi:thioredoxin-related protein
MRLSRKTNNGESAMKWFAPTIIGGAVLVLVISFARVQRATALAAQAETDAQVVSAVAAQRTANAQSGAPRITTDRSISTSDEPATSNDAGQSDSAKPDKPALSATSDALPDPSETGVEPAAIGVPATQPPSQTSKKVFLVQYHDATALADALKRIAPNIAGKITVDTRSNSLLLDGLEPGSLKILEELDQPVPKKTFDAGSETVGAPRVSDSKPAPVFQPSAKSRLLALTEKESRLLEIPTRIKQVDQFDPAKVRVETVENFNQIRVIGLALGFTPLVINDEHGREYLIDVLVTGDVKQFEALVRLTAPGAAIQVVTVKNSALLHGWVDQQDDIAKIVDIAELHFTKVLNHLKVRSVNATSADAAGSPTRSPDSLTRLPILGKLFELNAVSSDTMKSPAAQEYRQFDTQASALANAYRQQLATSPQDAKALDQLKSELQSAVHAAFHARQSWQMSQAAQLRRRLEQIDRRISERGQSADEIIQRRIDELLHPEKQWEQENTAAAALPVGSSPGPMPGAMAREIQRGNSSVSAATQAADDFSADAAPTPTGSAVAVDPDSAQHSVADKCWEILGLRLQKVSAGQLGEVKNRFRGGMHVVEVRPASVAANSGIKCGDFLVAVYEYETLRWVDINYVLHQGKLTNGSEPVKFYVVRGNEVLYGTLKFGDNSARKTVNAVPDASSSRTDTVNAVIGNRTGNGLATAQATGPVRDLESPGNPRRRVLDAALELNAAQAAIDQAKALLADSEQALKRLQSIAPGTIPQKMIFDAELDVKHKRIGLERLVTDLEIKQRQFEDAKEMLAAQIKFLEIDLADAKLRLQHAADDLSRAANLYKNAAISNEEYNAKLLAQRLAVSQQERAQLLLELYRKALPDKAAPIDKDQSAADAKFNELWTSDFKAAQEKARQLHRPLIVLFWASYNAVYSAKLKNEVLATPELLKFVSERLVGVTVDIAAKANRKKTTEYNINLLPTVIVFSETGEVLGRVEGFVELDDFLDVLNQIKQVSIPQAPEGTTQPAAEEKPKPIQPGGGDAVPNDEKPTETTPKAGGRSNDKPQE